jgi:hypothetical protein
VVAAVVMVMALVVIVVPSAVVAVVLVAAVVVEVEVVVVIVEMVVVVVVVEERKGMSHRRFNSRTPCDLMRRAASSNACVGTASNGNTPMLCPWQKRSLSSPSRVARAAGLIGSSTNTINGSPSFAGGDVVVSASP